MHCRHYAEEVIVRIHKAARLGICGNSCCVTFEFSAASEVVVRLGTNLEPVSQDCVTSVHMMRMMYFVSTLFIRMSIDFVERRGNAVPIE